MKTWTVIGIYADNHQKYATSVDTETAQDAEMAAQAACVEANSFEDLQPGTHPLIIAGVIEGVHEVA